MAVFGYLLDALVLQRIIGQPQLAIVILTISPGLPVPRRRWLYLGPRDADFRDTLHQPRHQCSRRYPAAREPFDDWRHRSPRWPPLPLLQFYQARKCHAGGLAEPTGGLLHGHSREAHQLADFAQYGYVGADIIVKALEAAGRDLTRPKFLAALESIKDHKPFFPGPTLSYGPDKHQGSTATFLAKVEGGRWKVIAENLLY